jgi:hypothetical protein
MRVAGNVAEMEDAVDSHEGWGHPGAEGPWASVMTLILMVGECPPVLEICFFGGSIWFSCVGQSRTEVVCGVTREGKNFPDFWAKFALFIGIRGGRRRNVFFRFELRV